MNEQIIHLAQPKLSRTLFLYGNVDEYVTTKLISEIREINKEEMLNNLQENAELVQISKEIKVFNENIKGTPTEIRFVEKDVEPIELHIATGGGSVEDGLALINIIRTSSVPVHACVHFAHSMGFLVASACDYRLGYSTTRMMYHEMSYGDYGKVENFKRNLNSIEVLKTLFEEVILDNTKLTKEKLDEMSNNLEDKYFVKDELLEFGLVDEIIPYNIAQHKETKVEPVE